MLIAHPESLQFFGETGKPNDCNGETSFLSLNLLDLLAGKRYPDTTGNPYSSPTLAGRKNKFSMRLHFGRIRTSYSAL